VSNDQAVADHYTSGGIWDRLRAALVDDGADLEVLSIEDLAPYDQFHGRGLAATEELADGLRVHESDRILDVGSGLGGPARYLANRFGCQMVGIDLTTEFCQVAERLNSLTGLDQSVRIHEGSALAMPFEDSAFDGAYSMNVSMNIADRSSLYREIHRVLRPGAWLIFSEIAQGPNSGLDYPTPWARTEHESFLLSPDETLGFLEASGFQAVTLTDMSAASAEFGARSRELIERGEKPLQRAVQVVHGSDGRLAGTNISSGLKQKQILPIEVHCTKPG